MRPRRPSSQHAPLANSDRRTLVLAALSSTAAIAGCRSAPVLPSEAAFPGSGRRFLATFPAFRAELHFHSSASLTWHLLRPDGSKGRSETVDIGVQQVLEQVFLVTWQEANKTTVVQVEDFARMVIFTHITRPDGTFIRSKGTFAEIG